MELVHDTRKSSGTLLQTALLPLGPPKYCPY